MNPYTSNRGITMYPDMRYQDIQQYYNQGPAYNQGSPDSTRARVGGGGGGSAAAQQASFGDMFAPFFQQNLGGGQRSGGGQTVAIPYRGGGRFGRGMPGTRLNWGGGGSGGSGGGGGGQVPGGGQVIPPATTQPQTPVGQPYSPSSAAMQLAQIDSGINAGRVTPQMMASSYNAFQGLLGSPQGYMGSLMSQYGNQAGLDLQRNMLGQAGQANLAADQARAQGNIDKMNLVYNTERENVLNQVGMRNALINLFAGLAGNFV